MQCNLINLTAKEREVFTLLCCKNLFTVLLTNNDVRTIGGIREQNNSKRGVRNMKEE